MDSWISYACARRNSLGQSVLARRLTHVQSAVVAIMLGHSGQSLRSQGFSCCSLVSLRFICPERLRHMLHLVVLLAKPRVGGESTPKEDVQHPFRFEKLSRKRPRHLRPAKGSFRRRYGGQIRLMAPSSSAARPQMGGAFPQGDRPGVGRSPAQISWLGVFAAETIKARGQLSVWPYRDQTTRPCGPALAGFDAPGTRSRTSDRGRP